MFAGLYAEPTELAEWMRAMLYNRVLRTVCECKSIAQAAGNVKTVERE
jgi:hypothetical protein